MKTIQEIREYYPHISQYIPEEDLDIELDFNWRCNLSQAENVLANTDRDLNIWFEHLPLHAKEQIKLLYDHPFLSSEGDGFFIETPEPEDKQMSFNFNNITKMERPNGKDK